jgi:hypothetical protein
MSTDDFNAIRAAAEAESSPERQAEMENLAEIHDQVAKMTAIEIIAMIEAEGLEQSDGDTCDVLADLAAAIRERFQLP